MLKSQSFAIALAALAATASAEVNVDSLKAQVDALAKIKVSGFLQARYEYGIDTSVIDSKSSQIKGRFNIRRGRVIVSNEGALGDFSVQVQYAEDGIKLIDAYVSAYDPWKMVKLRIGSQAIPYGYEVSGWSSSSMEVLERSLFEQTVFPGEHDLGAVLSLNCKKDFFQYVDIKAGVFSGNMSVVGVPVLGNSANGVSQADFDDGKAFVGRVGFQAPLPSLGLDFSGGVSEYYDVLTSQNDTVYDFAGQLDNTNATSHISRGNSRLDLHKQILDVDLQVNAKLLDLGSTVLRGELYTGANVALSSGAIFDPYSSSLPSTAVANVATNKAYIRNALGWNVLLAQNLGAFQVAARFEQFDPNTDIDAAGVGATGSNTSIADVAWTQISGAVSYNLSSNVKFMIEYDHKTNETIGTAFTYKAGSDNRDYTTDVNNDKTTFQLQYKF